MDTCMSKEQLTGLYSYIYERFIDLHPRYNHISHTWGPMVDFYTPIEGIDKDEILFSITVFTKTEDILFVYKGRNNTKKLATFDMAVAIAAPETPRFKE